ncbi:MAG TPA: insulinase family protein, partial [Pyrinomonadaceae bacterium]|nr:insulinase family protein [Pyrinomonadaceae bacterium]
MKRSLLLILLACSIINPAAFAGQKQQEASGRVTAQSGADAAPAPQPQTKFLNRQLANGLEMIVVEDHSIPLVTCELAVRNGSFTEPPELNGLSHLFEHMFFKANRASVTGETYLNTIDQLGIIYNGQTQEE